MEDADSNMLILADKKKTKMKRKGMNKEPEMLHVNKKPRLSKSQRKKIKKMEEEKEKTLLLSKTLETLEKYKIPDDAFLLLRSSKNIGQDETRLEKRSRAVQFSKAGIEALRSDLDLNKCSGFHALDRTPLGPVEISPKPYVSVDTVHPILVGREVANNACVSLDLSRGPESDNVLGNTGDSDTSLQAEEAMAANSHLSLKEDKRNSSPPPYVDCCTESCTSRDSGDASQKIDSSKRSNLKEIPIERPLSAPIVVHVSRPSEVENKRKDLPIVMMEQEIMEAINENFTIIICGETGCGKTTQVPQFLYEAGFGSSRSSVRRGIIGVTQPRRVAVLATAKRVAYELGLRLGKEVGFQVRYDKKIGETSSIKFMTDGILLREVQNDFLLKRYSVIILDEAHERSLNTDILIGMLSRVVKLRQDLYRKQQQMVLSGQSLSPESVIFPLNLVLMSATLRVEDFISGGRLFHIPPPVIEVPTRQFPVTVHFSKRTVEDYTGQAYKKILAIHKRLPPGGILVFVTGQKEVEDLCRKLHRASRELIKKKSEGNIGNDDTNVSEIESVQGINMKDINEAFEINGHSSDQQTDRFSSYDEDRFDIDVDGESDVSYDSETESELEFTGDEEEELWDQKTLENGGNLLDVLGEGGTLDQLRAAFDALAGNTASNSKPNEKQIDPETSEGCLDQLKPRMGKKRDKEIGFTASALHVLPLYAMLPAAAQLRVFEEVKEEERLVVVATNVAETSLTIPGIKYVVDTGKEKVKTYNPLTGMESYEIQFISKASAAQRAGRAGRTGPGHCYRLYSTGAFSKLPDFSLAEIAKIPVDGVVLLMKSMGIDKVANFPFPTPPETTAILEAERCLKALAALDSNGRLTPLGKAMARYPMSPRHSRMLLTVIQIMKNVKSYARANLVLAYAVAAAAALSLSNPFVMSLEGNESQNNDLKQDEGTSYLDGEKVIDEKEKLKKKKLKEAVRVSRAKFSNLTSDALAIAFALQCFELSDNPVGFCSDYALQLKSMEEVSKLRKQLLQLVFAQTGVLIADQDFSWNHGTLEDVEHAWKISSNKHPLLLNEEEILGQAICAGWADRVAKRIRVNSNASEGDRKARAVRYQPCIVKETVFLHRWSFVSNSAPEFLVYTELLHTKRPYMHGVTSVKPAWLVKYASSLCTFSAPLTDPKPYYEPQSDQVFCWVTSTFGPHLWELPLHNLPIGNDLHRVTVFAYALLEGQILPCLKSVRKHLAASPSSILRPGASGQKRVGNLLTKLKTQLIDSCAMLRAIWKENPHEFHLEIRDWFQESFHKHFEEVWSQMHSEVILDPQERFLKKAKRIRS